ISIQITGITNTPTRSTMASTIVVYDGPTAVASGTTPTISFTTTGLTALSWSSSDTVNDAIDAAYTYGFTTGSAANLNKITMTVPPGTSGTPTVGAVSAQADYPPVIENKAVSLSGTTLTF